MTGLVLAALIAPLSPGPAWAEDAAAGALTCAYDRVEIVVDKARHGFSIEVAVTPEEQRVGLMFRPSMPADHGMLFVFSPPRPASFWMKNTMISLDMLFIDAAGQVVNIAERTEPYSLAARSSDGVVRAVLEINGGLSESLGIGPGARVVHPVFVDAPFPYRCPPPE